MITEVTPKIPTATRRSGEVLPPSPGTSASRQPVVTPDASLSNGKTVSNRDVLSISSEGQKIAGSPATSTHESETKQPSVAAANQEELDSLVQALNQHMSRSNLRLRFGTDEESGLDYFQLYDRKNGDVVKQYPPEEVLELTAQLQDLAGTMFNQEA